jgi:signal transduction histidine kinase
MNRDYLRRFKELIGPYNFTTLFVVATTFLINQVRLRQIAYSYPFGSERVRFFLIGSFIDLVVALLVYICLRVSFTFWRVRPVSLRIYFVRIAVVILISNITELVGSKVLIPRFHIKDFLIIDNFFALFTLKFLFALIFISVTHGRAKALELKLAEAERLNGALSERYSALIETDEEIRDQAAKLLHDRIQGELMLAAARLSRTVQGLPADAQEEIVPVIKVLEKIRSTDVRQVTQLLTPNLASEGLIGACETLCEGFNSEIDIELQISRGIEMVDENIKLGLFRIIEQGLMNSIKHGPASHVIISVSIDHSEAIHAEITDNGPGSSSEKAGKGSQIIDAWVAILGGFKEIENQLGRGYTLRITLPINQPTK